jgi:membrane-associated phospholipid phosphatase
MDATTSTLEHFSLPLFANARNRHFAGSIIFLLGFGAYLLTNHWQLTSPQLLPFTWVDSAVPLVPTTVWIYNTEFLYFLTTYLLISDDLESLSKYCYAFIALLFTSVLIFTAWPTTYPRDSFPLPAGLDFATAYVFNSLRNADTPVNCCPSLHVSGVYLSSFVLLEAKPKWFWSLFFWGSLIALSTLTTKQHYLVDVLTGLGMAILFYWIFFKKVPYRKVV